MIAKLFIYALTLFMLSFEYFQVIDNGWDYLKERTNWVDQCSSALIFFMVLKNDYFPKSIYNLQFIKSKNGWSRSQKKRFLLERPVLYCTGSTFILGQAGGKE